MLEFIHLHLHLRNANSFILLYDTVAFKHQGVNINLVNINISSLCELLQP